MMLCFFFVWFVFFFYFFFFQAEDGIRDHCVTGVQTCALPIFISGVALLTVMPEAARRATPETRRTSKNPQTVSFRPSASGTFAPATKGTPAVLDRSHTPRTTALPAAPARSSRRLTRLTTRPAHASCRQATATKKTKMS